MTELELHQETLSQTSSLVNWAMEADAAYRIAQRLVKTPFCPQSLQDPAAAAAAILAGQEVNLAPMAALRSIDVIQGTPAMRAVAMRALVQGAGHEVWVDDSNNDTKAVVYGQRAGSERVQKSTWTIARATGLGLTNKQNWKSQPGAMLVARATSEVCRLIASDVLLGLAYSAEELDTDAGDVPVEAPKRVRRKQSEPAPPVDEPELEPPVAEVIPDEVDWPPVKTAEPELEP